MPSFHSSPEAFISTIVEIFEALIFAALLLGGLGVFLLARYQGDMQKVRQRVRAASHIAETPCGEIEYAISGEGMPVLVVHGAGGGYDQGLDIAAPLLGAGFQLIAPSRFGYLRTPLPADASAEAQADAHACLLDALNIERAVVVGASAGAPSAMQFAQRYPERTAALVLLVPATWTPPPAPAPGPKLSPRMRRLLEKAAGSDFLFWLLLRFAPHFSMRAVLGTPYELVAKASADERTALGTLLSHLLPVSRRRSGLMNDAAVVGDLARYDLENIAAPTLIMSVEDDPVGTYAGARYSAAHIPNARFVGYPTGGHLAAGHRNAFAQAVADFLKGVSGA